MTAIIQVYCQDCRGRFEINSLDVEEEEIIECSLCMAEIEIIQMDPFKTRLFSEE